MHKTDTPEMVTQKKKISKQKESLNKKANRRRENEFEKIEKKVKKEVQRNKLSNNIDALPRAYC